MPCILQQREASDTLKEHDGKTSTGGEKEEELDCLRFGRLRERKVGMLGRLHI